jgi:hypothetical protein
LKRLTYRGRTWFRIFFIAWYAFLAVFAGTLLTVGTDPPLHGADRLLPVVLVVGFAIGPVILHVIGTRRSQEELEELVDFLRRVAEARPQFDGQWRAPVLTS